MILCVMHRYVNALIWQCAITDPHVFGRSDSILSLSRYIATCVDGRGLYYRVLNNIELQRLDTNFHYSVVVKHYLNYSNYIRIVYFLGDSDCHAMLIVLRMDNKYLNYTIHWNGKIYSIRNFDTPHECDLDCDQKVAKPRLDAFVKEFLRFRRIRIRKTES